MKKLLTVLLALIFILSFAACSDEPDGPSNEDITGTLYAYDQISFPSDDAFTIYLDEDGTFSYSEGSEHMGTGKWTRDGDTLTLTEDGKNSYVNYFKIEDGCLIFIESKSNNFRYIELEDGAKFIDLKIEV